MNFKKASTWILVLMLTIGVVACSPEEIDDINSESTIFETPTIENERRAIITSSCAVYESSYIVTLETKLDNQDGTWTWVWSVQNPNPGNGKNGTFKDLSHWNLNLGCITLDNITDAATSMNGVNFQSFNYNVQNDPSMSCDDTETGGVFKFDVGTIGSTKTYYSLTINEDRHAVQNYPAYWKAGRNCGIVCYPGIGC